MSFQINTKRVYENIESKDGFRILVDRLWPRGFSKEKLKADIWMKEIAPRTELRKWFNHDPKKWIGFQKKYGEELKTKKEPLTFILDHLKKENVTLLYAAKDTLHNEALVIANTIQP